MSKFTKHGSTRKQQRGIPQLILDWLIEYGRVTRRRGADVYSFDKDGRRRLRRDIGGLAYNRLEDFFDAYVVLSDDGNVITMGWRLKRLKT
jgi:hypothetical protein